MSILALNPFFLGFSGGAVGVLAGCVGCLCVLLRLFGFTLSLPKVACHGGDVGDDSFFLRLPYGQYGPVSQLSRSEERCSRRCSEAVSSMA